MPERKKNSFLGGAAVLAAGIVIVKILGAIYKIPIVNVLGSSYADFQNAYYIYALLLTISTAGLPVALSKMVAAADARGEERQVQKIFRVSLGVFLALGVASFFVMFFGADWLADLLNDPLASKSIRALSPAVICVGCLASFRGYAQGHSNMVPTAVSQIIEALCKLVIGLTLAVLAVKAGRSGDTAAAMAIVGVTTGSFVALAYMILEYLRSRRPARTDEETAPAGSILRELLAIAIPITLTSSAVSVINLIDTSLVQGRLQKSLEMTLDQSRELFSAYSGVMTLYNLPASLIIAITASIIPAVSASLARSDQRGAARVARASLRITALLVLPMGAGLSVLAKPIVQMLFHRLDPEVSGPLLAMLGIASVFVCIMSVSNSILQAYGYERLPVLIMILGGVVKIVVNFNLVAIPSVNINGAPIGTLCCFGLAAVLDLIVIRRILPRPPRYGRMFRGPLLATVLMALSARGSYWLASLFLGNTLSTLLAMAMAAAVYFFLVVFLQLISREDLSLMPKGEKLADLLRLPDRRHGTR